MFSVDTIVRFGDRCEVQSNIWGREYPGGNGRIDWEQWVQFKRFMEMSYKRRVIGTVRAEDKGVGWEVGYWAAEARKLGQIFEDV